MKQYGRSFAVPVQVFANVSKRRVASKARRQENEEMSYLLSATSIKQVEF